VTDACRLLPLTCLAPSIVEEILAGRADHALMLEELERPLPASWEDQRARIASPRCREPSTQATSQLQSTDCCVILDVVLPPR
jgi:hypothetical protein